jgi:hypothetical protein
MNVGALRSLNLSAGQHREARDPTDEAMLGG